MPPLLFLSAQEYMTNNKRIILLTGTTCAGKSTILEAIKLVDEPSVKIIPQVTTRQPRTDDDTSLFVYKKQIIPEQLFLYNTELTYGISKQSISEFIISNYSTAVMITGTDEVEMLSNIIKEQNIYNIDFKNILITHSQKPKNEIQTLKRCLPVFFDKINTQKRFNYFKGHIKNKLLNNDFIKNNINLHLTREMSITRWGYELSKIINVPPSKIIYALEKQIAENNKKEKRYIAHEKQLAISQILTYLEGSKREI